MASIFSNLPNNLIFKIIKMNTEEEKKELEDHKKAFEEVEMIIERVGETAMDCDDDSDDFNVATNFLYMLYHQYELTKTIIDLRSEDFGEHVISPPANRGFESWSDEDESDDDE
jgi:hypothetical protein